MRQRRSSQIADVGCVIRVGLMKFLSRSSFWMPDYIVESAWLEHAPFAFWLIETHRPRVVVELGTHRGFSFCCFCQAIERISLNAKAYAVDTWKGDEHAGFYGDEIFQELSSYLERHSSCANLVRSTFDEALPLFEDGSVDLLHIDGRHFYDDVKHDFETWLPKLSSRGVVLFHDTNVKERGFGVFQFWEELATRYPSFEFFHGHGLGILCVGPNQDGKMLDFVATSNDDSSSCSIQEVYSTLGGQVQERAEAHKNLDSVRQALFNARKKPLSTLWRYCKWQSSGYLMLLRPILGASFYKRMKSRREKNSPEFLRL